MQVSFRAQELQFAGDVTLEFGAETGESLSVAVGERVGVPLRASLSQGV
jgi:hypothetical protein